MEKVNFIDIKHIKEVIMLTVMVTVFMMIITLKHMVLITLDTQVLQVLLIEIITGMPIQKAIIIIKEPKVTETIIEMVTQDIKALTELKIMGIQIKEVQEFNIIDIDELIIIKNLYIIIFIFY